MSGHELVINHIKDNNDLHADLNNIKTNQTNGLKLNTNHTGSGSVHYATCDNSGRTYVVSDVGVPINALLDSGGQQSLRCEDGKLRVDNVDGNADLVVIRSASNSVATYSNLIYTNQTNGSQKSIELNEDFGSVVSIKDDESISGAYQFNSVLGDIKKRDKITLEIRSNTASPSWTCELGFSMDGVIWTDTISNINAVPAIQQIVQVDVIAPYWRFVFINSGVASNWTIKYIIS